MLSSRPSHHLAIIVLAILHLVGWLGLMLPLYPDFAKLTPLNLLVSVLVLLYFEEYRAPAYRIALLLVFAAGFGVECLGVNTGFPFGSYYYGESLGLKLWGVPLMMGINWITTVYCTVAVAQKLAPDAGQLFGSLLAAVLTVALDLMIEPAAVSYDFWHWQEPDLAAALLLVAPYRNYFAWFIVSFLLAYVFRKLTGRIENKTATALFGIQFLFFAGLFVYRLCVFYR